MKCSCSRARTSESGRYCAVRSVPVSPIGMVSIKVRPKPLPCVQRSKRLDLVLVHAPERDRIDLDLDAGPVGGVDAAPYLGEIAPAGDRLEPRRIKRIERDVDSGDAAVRERLGIAGRAGCHWW